MYEDFFYSELYRISLEDSWNIISIARRNYRGSVISLKV